MLVLKCLIGFTTVMACFGWWRACIHLTNNNGIRTKKLKNVSLNKVINPIYGVVVIILLITIGAMVRAKFGTTIEASKPLTELSYYAEHLVYMTTIINYLCYVWNEGPNKTFMETGAIMALLLLMLSVLPAAIYLTFML